MPGRRAGRASDGRSRKLPGRIACRPGPELLESRRLLTIHFAPPSTDIGLGYYVVDVATGDFTGNGLRDIIAIAADNGSSLAGLSFRLPNQGGATFGAPVAVSTPPNPRQVVVADFNGDGLDDLAASQGWNNFVDVAISNGDGTFQPTVAYPSSGGTGGSLTAADLDGDGDIDLAIGTGNYDISLLFNLGDGTFGPTQSLPADSVTTIAAADLNGDGLNDLVYGQYFLGSVAVALNQGGGAFTNPPSTYATPNLVSVVRIGDFNNDGSPDLAAVAGETVSILLNRGDGTFDPPLMRPLPSTPGDIALGDFDNDGNLDVALALPGPVQVLPGLGTGRFGDTLFFDDTAPGEASIAAADLTGSGRLDLVYGVGGNVRVMLNDSPPSPAGALGFGSAVYTAAEGGGPATITVTRTGGSAGAVSVRYATAAGTATNGVQYQDVSGTLTFGDGETTKTFTVPILNAPGGPDPSFVTVNLALSLAGGGAILGHPAVSTLRIAQNVAPVLGVGDATAGAVPGQAVFTVASSFPIAQPVTVHFATRDGTAIAGVDYAAVSATLTFAPGETTKTVSVPILGNPAAIANTTFTVVLTDPTGAVIGRGQGTGTITAVPVLPLVAQGATVNARENEPASLVVATFTDPNGAADPGSYSAVITWGDGATPSPGTIERSGNGFVVVGTHLFGLAGTYGTRVAITRKGSTNLTFGQAVVAPNDLLPGLDPSFSPTASTPFVDATVATFVDRGGAMPAGSYLATIDWGDGSPPSVGFQVALAPIPNPGGNAYGVFAIRGAHAYRAAGLYPLAVTIQAQDGSIASTRGLVEVKATDGPRVTGVTVDRARSRITVGLKGTDAPLDLASVANSANYLFTRQGGPAGAYVVTGIAVGSPGADGSVTATLAINGGRKRLPNGGYILRIVSGGIVDARNIPLDGEYYGSFPTGDGKPGGGLVARVVVNQGAVRRLVPIYGYVAPNQQPRTTAAKSVKSGAHEQPGGPLRARAHARAIALRPPGPAGRRPML